MQYDGDFSAGRIAREREKIGKCLDDYAEVRDKTQDLLTERIKDVRGGLLAVPDAEDDGYEPQTRSSTQLTLWHITLRELRLLRCARRHRGRRQSRGAATVGQWASTIRLL